MNALAGVHAKAWGMPNHGQHLLVDGGRSAANVTPDEAVLIGTVRTFTTEVLDLIERRMQEMAKGVASAFAPRLPIPPARFAVRNR